MTDRAAALIDLSALRHNISSVRSGLPDKCDVMAVVKADAYGHGAAIVAPCLYDAGVRRYAVATMGEALDLRRCVSGGEVLVLGYVPPDQLDQACEHDVALAICDKAHARAMADRARAFGARAKFHVAVDTGMTRLGAMPDECADVVRTLIESGARVTGIFSHLCAADTDSPADAEFTHAQAAAFDRAVSSVRAAGLDVGIAHLLASAGTMNYHGYAYDCVRLGIVMYGVRTFAGEPFMCDVELEPVMKLVSRVSSVRTIERGASVGYGRTFVAEKETRVATISAGYADGIPRAASGGRLRAIVRGKFAHGVGRVCMDQSMFDVTDIDGVEPGDIVTLIGRADGLEITAEEVAAAAGTVTHDIFCGIGARVERRAV